MKKIKNKKVNDQKHCIYLKGKFTKASQTYRLYEISYQTSTYLGGIPGIRKESMFLKIKVRLRARIKTYVYQHAF